MVTNFRRSDSFQPAALGFAQSPDAKFSRWIELAETYQAELIARPFSKETMAPLDNTGISAMHRHQLFTISRSRGPAQ